MKITYNTKANGPNPKNIRTQEWWEEDANEVKEVVNINDTIDVGTAYPIALDRIQGRRYGTWGTPLTGDITVDTTNWVEGACAVVIWSGDENPEIVGATVQNMSGTITKTGSYSIYLHYLNNRLNVNIFNPDADTPTIGIPVAPSLLTLTQLDNAGDINIQCDWNESTPLTDLDHYELWRKTGSGGTYSQINSDFAIGVLTYIDDSPLVSGTSYFYEIRAYNINNQYNALEEVITTSIPGWKTVYNDADGQYAFVGGVTLPTTRFDMEFRLPDGMAVGDKITYGTLAFTPLNATEIYIGQSAGFDIYPLTSAEIAAANKIELTYNATTFVTTLTVDDIPITLDRTQGTKGAITGTAIGCFIDQASANISISYMKLGDNGIATHDYEMNEGSGTVLADSVGTKNLAITIGTGSISTVWQAL